MATTMVRCIAKTAGGKWRYNRHARWWEDSAGAIARWAIACDCDDECDHLPQLWLYGRGIPQRLDLSEQNTRSAGE